MIRKEWQRPAESFGKGFVGQRLAGLLALVAFVPKRIQLIPMRTCEQRQRAPDCSVGAPLSLSLCPYHALLTALSARVSRFWRAPDRVPPRYGPLSAGQGRARVDGTACMRQE